MATTCTGRVGALVNLVRADFNEETQKFISDVQLVAWLNQGIRDIASRTGYWRRETLINVVGGQEEYDLCEAIPDYLDVLDIKETNEDHWPCIQCRSWSEFHLMKLRDYAPGPRLWVIYSNRLYIHPVFDANEAGALTVFHTYLPPELGCTTSTSPELLIALDDLLAYFALFMIHRRRHADPGSANDAEYWRGMYEQGLVILAGQAQPPMRGVVPYR